MQEGGLDGRGWDASKRKRAEGNEVRCVHKLLTAANDSKTAAGQISGAALYGESTTVQGGTVRTLLCSEAEPKSRE